MSAHGHAVPRARRRKIRPPHPNWWFAVLMVSLSLVTIASDTAAGDINGAVVVRFAVQCWIAYVYWPALAHPQRPKMPDLGTQTAILVAILASLATSLLT
jgi:hypothetical protein